MKHKQIDFFEEIKYLRIRKPFLKWAGNKVKIIKEIKKILPEGDRLVEPFVGSASLFINTNFKKYLLADSNKDLINLFLILKNYKKIFINCCKKYFTPQNNNEKRYIDLKKEFNNTKDMFIKSAIFIYLNRYGFNGMCRYNSFGHFNIPFGKYDKPYFPEKEMEEFIENCQNKSVQFINCDFRKVFKLIEKNDVVYCDPPYYPISKTSSFTSYDGKIFTEEDQKDLVGLIHKCQVPVIISNSDTSTTRNLYKNASFIKNIEVRRFIGGNKEKINEIMAVFNF